MSFLNIAHRSKCGQRPHLLVNIHNYFYCYMKVYFPGWDLVDKPVGQRPLVVRLLKGLFNQRPPKPRYSRTWNVTKMLTYLKSLGSNESLSLKLLTQRLAMLLALILRHRSSDLVRLSLGGHRYTPDSDPGDVVVCGT